MKIVLMAGFVILVLTTGNLLAEKVTDPIISLDEINRRDAARFKQEQGDRVDRGRQNEIAKQKEANRSAEADNKLRMQKRARKRAINQKAHEANPKAMATRSPGEPDNPDDWGKANYCVSPAVQRDRQRSIRSADLYNCQDKSQHPGENAYWIMERDGALLLVDPLISQAD